MSMDWLLNPLKGIPKNLRIEYLDLLTKIVNRRTVLMSVVTTGLYILAYGGSVALFSLDLIPSELAVVIAVIVGSFIAYGGSSFLKSLPAAKWNGFIAILFPLSGLVLGAIDRTSHFNEVPFVLLFFFTALMVPWFVRDVLVIAALHFFAFYTYCITRNFSTIGVSDTIFGSDPLLKGAIHLTFATIICICVRISESKQHQRNFLLLKEVESKKNQMERELQLASRVHNSLLPQSFESEKANVTITYEPMASIGGDYAHFKRFEDSLIFFIGDVTGHGVSAALMVNRLHAEFERLAASGKRPGDILNQLNQFILKSFHGTGMYLTAFCGMLDFKEQKVFYSNYGHPPQYVFKCKDSTVMGLDAQTSLLGIDVSGESEIYESSVKYEKGDRILLFTDGILEFKNHLGEEYGAKRLQEFIQSKAELNADQIHSLLLQDLSKFGEGSFKDDIYIVSIDCR